MSIIVAVRKDDRTVMGTDTLTSFGEDTRVPGENSSTPKLRRIGPALMGAAGWAVYDRIFDDYLDERLAPDLTSERSIFTFFIDLWRALHEKYPFVNDQAQGRDSPFGDLDSTFLIASRGGIFKVSHDLDVCRFDQYYAIGSGAEYALGALHTLYSTDQEPEEIAGRAVRTASAFNVHCGGEPDVHVLE